MPSFKNSHIGVLLKHKIFAILIITVLAACGKPVRESTPMVNPSSPLPELPFAQELQDALDKAASNGQDDVIRVVLGTYNGNFTYLYA